MEDDEKLRVVGVHRSGRRTFDPVSKAGLIERCLQPGASVAGLALAHGVNANLVWKWLRRHRQAQEEMLAVARPCLPAFVPVEVEGAAKDVVSRRDGAGALKQRPHAAARSARAEESGLLCSQAKVTASLPNGMTLTLECSDARAVSAMIGALCDVPAGR
jgi:transposase